MRRLLLSSVVLAAFALGGCETTSLLKPKEPKTSTVCGKVTPPTEVPLNTFTFFPLPIGTMGEGGVPLVAGVTADGAASILQNHTVLKQRERNWRTRADAINNCLDKEAAERGKADAKRK